MRRATRAIAAREIRRTLIDKDRQTIESGEPQATEGAGNRWYFAMLSVGLIFGSRSSTVRSICQSGVAALATF